eukprot:2919404-Ditylum_brightwellii.AAC.1
MLVRNSFFSHPHKQTILWLCNFQLQVDELAEGDYFQFTEEVWKLLKAGHLPTMEEEDLEELLPEEWAKWEERVTVSEKEEFPYLDMKMYWENTTLQFPVYDRENQTIKYVSKESCHH